MARRVGLVALGFALACGSPPAPKPVVAPPVPSASVAPSASTPPSASAEVPFDPHFREHEPALVAETPFEMPRLHTARMANGMRLISANTGGGMFAMRIVFEGPAAFPNERFAVSKVMVRSMFGGTPTHDAHELRRVLEKRFSSWGTYTLADAISVDMLMPADDVRPCIDIMADVVMHTNLDQVTLGFELLQLVEQGQTARESPAVVGEDILMRALYGDNHVYARRANVLEGSPTVDRAEAQRVYQEMVDPRHATIVVSGSIERSLIDHIQRTFGSWQSNATTSPTPVAAITWKSGPRIVVVDRPGSVQSQVTFGGLAPSRSSPDWFAMTMIHELLGAHQTSRLTRTLVEQEATSSTGSTHYTARRNESAFYWESSVPLAKTAAVLAEIDKQFDELGHTPPPAAELDTWKQRYIRHLPLEMETAYGAVKMISTIPIDQLGDDALEKIVPGVRAVTPDSVRALAASRLSRDHTRVVVVGDWAKMKNDLKALGWGPIEIRDSSGKVLRTEK